ncbi:MAG: glycosyltransferase family 39 protein [Oscillospiraceae bacterium]|nr:glycosyltransferase family 39 protein [Oscillospiraceae bacterium]
MVAKKTDISSIGSSFLLMTAGVLFIYCLTGMTAARLNSVKCAVLFGVFVSFIAFYTVSRIKSIKAGLAAILTGVPVGFVSAFALERNFDAVQRMTIECFGIMMTLLLFGGLITLILSGISLAAPKKFKTEDAVFLVLSAGFVLRTIMVLFTPLNFYQHDVPGFGAGFQGFHDDYIMYIYENGALPDGDVRDLGQLYHPPLHYILSAVFFKINQMIFPGRSGVIDSLKTLPFIWSCGFVLFSLKILRFFNLKGTPLVISLAFVCFHPQMVFLAIQVNNDALALMLFAASVYLGLKWFEKPELTTILFAALAIGCAMMTKLSMGFVAFPVGFLFLVKFIGSLKKAPGKECIPPGGMIKQFVLFGVLAVPLGLWYPLRNYIEHGTPFTYVFTIDSTSGQDIWMYSAWQRLFAPSAESIRMPFLTMKSSEPGVDYNMFLALLKTSVFDERRFESQYLLTAGRVLLILAFVMVLICTACAVYITVRLIRQKRMTAGFISLLILCAVLIACFVNFCFGYPVVCTESFRYIVPVLPAAGVFLGLTAQELWKKLFVKIVLIAAVTAFSCAVFMFYGVYEEFRPCWELLIRH